MPSQEPGAEPVLIPQVMPEAPSLPLLILWCVGIALAFFTAAMLIWYGTLSRPDRLSDTLVAVSSALLAQVVLVRRWTRHIL